MAWEEFEEHVNSYGLVDWLDLAPIPLTVALHKFIYFFLIVARIHQLSRHWHWFDLLYGLALIQLVIVSMIPCGQKTSNFKPGYLQTWPYSVANALTRFSIDTELEQDTRNKSAEFLKNRNNCASETGPVDIIREPDQIRCDTGRTRRHVTHTLYHCDTNVRTSMRAWVTLSCTKLVTFHEPNWYGTGLGSKVNCLATA